MRAERPYPKEFTTLAARPKCRMGRATAPRRGMTVARDAKQLACALTFKTLVAHLD